MCGIAPAPAAAACGPPSAVGAYPPELSPRVWPGCSTPCSNMVSLCRSSLISSRILAISPDFGPLFFGARYSQRIPCLTQYEHGPCPSPSHFICANRSGRSCRHHNKLNCSADQCNSQSAHCKLTFRLWHAAHATWTLGFLLPVSAGGSLGRLRLRLEAVLVLFRGILAQTAHC